MQKELIEKLKNLSVEQLQLVANLINQIEIDSHAKAMKKWEHLLKYHQEMNDDDPISNEEIQIIRNTLRSQNKNIPLDLPKDDFFIADDFNDPLRD